MAVIARPDASEYAEFYETYVSKVPPGDVLRILADQHDESQALLAGIDEDKARFRYAPGKWSLKEVAGHLVDTERVFSYRGLAFARRDPNAFPGMDQDLYVLQGGFGDRPLSSIAEEWSHLRQANLRLFASWDEEVQLRRGQASGHSCSVRAIPYIVAGHERHHLQILRERYL
jgi:hypothetical protein